MNNRLNELGKLAGCPIDGMGYGEGNVEALVELVILECIDIMNITSKKANTENTYMGDDVPTSAHIYEIKKHFGIK